MRADHTWSYETWMALGVSMLLATASACGDGETDGDAGPAAGPPVTLTLSIRSSDIDFTAGPNPYPASQLPHVQLVELALLGAPADLEPVADVRVALDRPDGTRLGEATSDSDDLVAFEVPENLWPEDVALSATLYAGDDYLMHTRTGIGRPANAEPLVLTICRHWQHPQSDAMIRVEGRVLNRNTSVVSSSGGQGIYVLSTAPGGGWYDGRSDVFSLLTPAGVAFDLVAAEWISSVRSSWDYDQRVRWARVRSGAVDEDVILNIDLVADAIAFTEVEGSFSLPTRDPGRLTSAKPWLETGGVDVNHAPLGFEMGIHLLGSEVEYTVGVLETSDYGADWYRYFVAAIGPDIGPAGVGPRSIAYGRGRPDGRQPQLLDLPEWTGEGSQGDQGHPIDEPLSWEVYDEAVSQYLWISNGEEVVWVVDVPEDVTSVSLPAPPSNVDLAVLLGTSPRAIIALERQIDSEEGVFWLESWGEELALDLGE
jgi:hypothetical protein